jgi:ssDNA-binding Zn-finger/Zn-ribbon topoisomerase 1
MTFDTTRMLHTCGKKLTYQGIDNGCHVLVCPNKKCDGASYRFPVEVRKLISPCELITLPMVKVYKCRDCGAGIMEEQAKRTFQEEGRALCVICEGR